MDFKKGVIIQVKLIKINQKEFQLVFLLLEENL